MSSYIQSQFNISDKQMFDFTKPQPNSDSDEDELNQSLLLMNNKEYKKQKKLIDIESIKSELNKLPPFIFDHQQKKYSKKFQKASLRTLSNTFIPTSPILIEQLGQVKAIKYMKEQIPPEIMHKVYTQLRYQYIPAFNIVYRQGDQNKYYYIILDGRCVVLKPKEKMVGINSIEVELDQENKSTIDPYGLKSLFPEYMMMKMLFSGDSFGEVAIKLESSRASTVFAVENTHLLYMTEAAYVQLLDPYLSEALEEKIQYFKRNKLFTSADSDLNDIMGILLECRKITYKSGEIIYQEGNKSNSLFFIINGEVQLSKTIGDRNLVLSSYGEHQQFGEVEILNKVTRFTTARAISPRLIVYKIRKNKFFNNLGNFVVYDNMKKQSKLILQHWNIIYKSAIAQMNDQNNVYLHIDKKKTQEKRKKYHSSNHSMSQVQVYQNMTESGIMNDDSCELLTEEKGQRVFSNALQQYQQKLKKFGNQNFESQTKQVRELTYNDERPVPKLRQKKLEKFSFHAKLPSISPNKILPQMNLDQILDSITRLPKVPQDNLILSLMYQEAYKSNNPDKKARQVQQLIQASFKKVRKYQTSKEPILNQARFKSTDSLLKNLKINDSLEEKKEKIDYLNFENFSIYQFLIGSIILVAIYIIYQILDYRSSVKKPEQNTQQVQNEANSQSPPNPEKLDCIAQINDIKRSLIKQWVRWKKSICSNKKLCIDVSTSDSYKPDGPYEVFAGHDISISLGKMNITEEFLDIYGMVAQPEDEIANMNSWFSYFYSRYPMIGRIDDKKQD